MLIHPGCVDVAQDILLWVPVNLERTRMEACFGGRLRDPTSPGHELTHDVGALDLLGHVPRAEPKVSQEAGAQAGRRFNSSSPKTSADLIA